MIEESCLEPILPRRFRGMRGPDHCAVSFDKKLPSCQEITAQILNTRRHRQEMLIIPFYIPGQIRADGA